MPKNIGRLQAPANGVFGVVLGGDYMEDLGNLRISIEEAMRTPRTEGFTMPAEWTEHAACWMAWPCRYYEPPCDIEVLRDAYAALAMTVAQFEPVMMVTRAEHADDVQVRCREAVRTISMPLSHAWTRDTGPTFLVDRCGRLAGVDWLFNAWGGAFPLEDYVDDVELAQRILNAANARRFTAPICLEGGAIHTDGNGTVLTTETCLLNPNRNPGLSKRETEKILRDHLGAEKVIWLVEAFDDGSDGHVDNLACFVSPGVVVALSEADSSDGNYDRLQENLSRLRAATDASGHRLEVIPIQQPAAREFGGKRMALSYINFYIANGAAILPSFDDPQDAVARQTLRKVLPGRKIVQIPGLDMSTDMGCFHCATQQQPAADQSGGVRPRLPPSQPRRRKK
jgi:agmatine deiminase